MKIDNNAVKLSNLAPGSSKPSSKASRSSSSDTTDAADSAGGDVQISTLSARLGAIAASMPADAPVDTSRIAEIKDAIASGQFTINPDNIASGLIEDVRTMLSNKS